MKLLNQDDILRGMDLYVEYTMDQYGPVLLDYGLELDAETPINGPNGREIVAYRHHTSLRGYLNTRWLEDELMDFICEEEGIGHEFS